MNNWHDKAIGELVTFQRGFDLTQALRINGNIPIVSSSGVTGYHNEAKVKRSGVVIGRKGTLGTVHYVSGEHWPHDTSLWVKDFKGNDPKFIYYFLQLLHFENFDVGSANPTLNRNHVHKIKVKCPDLPIQRKIAGILSAYDDLIENNKRRIALLENMAEELYREWFVRFRFPGWREAEFEKGIPKGWSQIPLGEIANILMGQSPASEFYNTDGHGLPFHQGVGTYGDRFPKNENYCSVSGRTANEGDILFSVRAPVGRLNIASEKMIIGRGLSAIRHKENCQSYLFYLLKSAFASEDIIGNGSIFNSVGKDELIGFKLFKKRCRQWISKLPFC